MPQKTIECQRPLFKNVRNHPADSFSVKAISLANGAKSSNARKSFVACSSIGVEDRKFIYGVPLHGYWKLTIKNRYPLFANA